MERILRSLDNPGIQWIEGLLGFPYAEREGPGGCVTPLVRSGAQEAYVFARWNSPFGNRRRLSSISF